MESLPDEVLLYVFQIILDLPYYELYLKNYGRQPEDVSRRFPHVDSDKRCLGMLAPVCNRFRRLADSEALWEKVQLEALTEKDLSIFSGSLSTRRTEWIRILDIRVGDEDGYMDSGPHESAGWFDDGVMDLLNDNCPNLESLSVWFESDSLYSEDGKGFRNPSFHLPKLRKLLIDGAQKTESIRLACPQLESLSLDGAFAFKRFNLPRGSTLPLRELRVTDTFVGAAPLQHLLSHTGQSLTSLTLGTSEFAKDTLDNMVSEECLQEEDFVHIDRKIVEVVAQHSHNLETLRVSGDPKVPLAFHVSSLLKLAKACPKLKELQIDDNTKSVSMVFGGVSPYDAQWFTLNRVEFPSLTSLHLTLMHPKALVLQELPIMCPKLEKVQLAIPGGFSSNLKPKVGDFPIAKALRNHCPLLKRFYATRYRFVASSRTKPSKAYDLEQADEEEYHQLQHMYRLP